MSSYTKEWGSPGFSPGVYVDCTCGWSFSIADPRWMSMIHAQIRLHKRSCKKPLKPPPKKHEYSDTCSCYLCRNHVKRKAWLAKYGIACESCRRTGDCCHHQDVRR